MAKVTFTRRKSSAADEDKRWRNSLIRVPGVPGVYLDPREVSSIGAAIRGVQHQYLASASTAGRPQN